MQDALFDFRRNAMHKSPNLLPSHTDWQRYESPAVLRKHGREYLERFWAPSHGETALESALERMAKAFGAGIHASDDTILLCFENPEKAASCARHLRRFAEVETILVQLTILRRAAP
jgi:hypothetical protein